MWSFLWSHKRLHTSFFFFSYAIVDWWSYPFKRSCNMDTLSSKYDIYTAVEKVTSPWVFPVQELLHREMIGADSGCIQSSIFTPENKASCPIFCPERRLQKNRFEVSLWFVKLPSTDMCCKRGFKNGQNPDITPDIRTFSLLARNTSNASFCNSIAHIKSPGWHHQFHCDCSLIWRIRHELHAGHTEPCADGRWGKFVTSRCVCLFRLMT